MYQDSRVELLRILVEIATDLSKGARLCTWYGRPDFNNSSACESLFRAGMDWTDAGHNLCLIGNAISGKQWDSALRYIADHISLFEQYQKTEQIDQIHQPVIWAKAIRSMNELRDGVMIVRDETPTDPIS